MYLYNQRILTVNIVTQLTDVLQSKRLLLHSSIFTVLNLHRTANPSSTQSYRGHLHLVTRRDAMSACTSEQCSPVKIFALSTYLHRLEVFRRIVSFSRE